MKHVLDFASRWRSQFDELLLLSVSLGPNSLSFPFTYFILYTYALFNSFKCLW